MKRLLSETEHKPLPGTIVFEDIPSDIWFVIATALSSFHDISCMGNVCQQFKDVVARRVKKLSTETIFESMHAKYVYHGEKYWPVDKERRKVIHQTWKPSSKPYATSFSRALVLFMANFMDHRTVFTFFLWGNRYELTTSKGAGNGMLRKYFIIYRKHGEINDGTCYCEKHRSPVFLEVMTNIFKDQLCHGLGCKERYEIYYRISTVALLIRLLKKLQCLVCYQKKLESGAYSSDNNILLYHQESTKVPLCILNPDSITHLYM